MRSVSEDLPGARGALDPHVGAVPVLGVHRRHLRLQFRQLGLVVEQVARSQPIEAAADQRLAVGIADHPHRGGRVSIPEPIEIRGRRGRCNARCARG